MGDFVFDYFMGAVFEGVVVDFLAVNATSSTKNTLFVVAKLGL